MKIPHLAVLSAAFLVSCTGNGPPMATPAQTDTPVRTVMVPTREPATRGREQVLVPVLCTLKGRPAERVFARSTPIMFTWGWEAKTEEQVDDFLESNVTIIKLDGGIISEGLFYEKRKKADSDLYEVIWARDVGVLPTGTHELIYDLKFQNKIFDGFREYGPRTDVESMHDECRITLF
jgi:hypothetical protein